jgi:hypothetical protein
LGWGATGTRRNCRTAGQIVASKEEAYSETIRRLDGGVIGCRWMRFDRRNTKIPLAELQRKRIFDVLAQKGYAKDWSQAKLLVRDDPYFP